MALLPIWIESWQIGCCGDAHVAETGKRWSEALMIGIESANPIEGELDRWWRPVDDGWIEFQARAEPVFEGQNRGVLLDFGSVRAFANPEPALPRCCSTGSAGRTASTICSPGTYLLGVAIGKRPLV